MISRIQDKFGTAGLVVAIVALVAALAGTAFAAAGLNGKQKKQVTAIAKKYAGKQGPAGPAGPVGPAGPAGAKGEQGADGADGNNGQSVTSSAATVGECPDGGIKLTSSSGSTAICNGADGEEGPEGSPWTAEGFLPAGATQTGTWGDSYTEGEVALIPISFSLPLEQAPAATLVPPSESTADCPGVVEGVPTAEPGQLCVYEAVFQGNFPEEGFTAPGFLDPTAFFGPGANKTGAVVLYECTSAVCRTYGTWAVTAAE